MTPTAAFCRPITTQRQLSANEGDCLLRTAFQQPEQLDFAQKCEILWESVCRKKKQENTQKSRNTKYRFGV